MIHIVFSAPCVYDRKQRGLGDAEIGYVSEDPVKTAKRYVAQIPGAILYSVYMNGVAYLDLL